MPETDSRRRLGSVEPSISVLLLVLGFGGAWEIGFRLAIDGARDLWVFTLSPYF
jgi:hypothetical protein